MSKQSVNPWMKGNHQRKKEDALKHNERYEEHRNVQESRSRRYLLSYGNR